MKFSITTLALAVGLAMGSAAVAQPNQQQNQQNNQQQSQQQSEEQRKAIVTATGTVIDTRRIATQDGAHELAKVRTADGDMVVADLGVPGARPAIRKGDEVIVSGRAGRINGKPVIFARYVGELQQVGRTGPGAQQQAKSGSSASAGTSSGAGWMVVSITPVEVLSAAEERRDAFFQSLDANGDRQISRREARGHAEIGSNFQTLDRDRDGMLGWAEFVQVQVADGQKQSTSNASSGGTQGLQRRFERLTFGLLDDDKDGVISRAEAQDLPDLAQSFSRLDGNQDGMLTRKEFTPGFAQAIWTDAS